jgi:hypothetical protein
MNSHIENIKEYFDDELKIDFTICDFSLKIDFTICDFSLKIDFTICDFSLKIKKKLKKKN